jgi:hypothetical protein
MLTLLGCVIRGRACQPVYVVLQGDLSDALRAELDVRNWSPARISVPRHRQDQFVVIAAEPDR